MRGFFLWKMKMKLKMFHGLDFKLASRRKTQLWFFGPLYYITSWACFEFGCLMGNKSPLVFIFFYFSIFILLGSFFPILWSILYFVWQANFSFCTLHSSSNILLPFSNYSFLKTSRPITIYLSAKHPIFSFGSQKGKTFPWDRKENTCRG